MWKEFVYSHICTTQDMVITVIIILFSLCFFEKENCTYKHPHDVGKTWQSSFNAQRPPWNLDIRTTREKFKIIIPVKQDCMLKSTRRGKEESNTKSLFFFLEKFFSRTSALRDKKIKHEIFFLRKIVLANIRTMRGNIYICNYI